MLKTLILLRLKMLMATMFSVRQSKNRSAGPGSKLLVGFLFLYLGGTFFAMFYLNFSQMYAPLTQAGFKWLYFAMAGISASVFMFIGSVFTSMSLVYESKDNDQMLSMPIPTSYILLSRIIVLMVLDYVLELLVLLPASIIYLKSGSLSPVSVISLVVVFVCLPLLTLALSLLIGWVIAKLTTMVRNKSIISTIFSLLFLVVYMVFYTQLNTYIQKIIINSEEIAGNIKKAVLPLYWLGISIADGDLLSLLLFAAVCIIPFVLIYIFISKTFIKIATSKNAVKKKTYVQNEKNTGKASTALMKKELRHFVSNSNYLLNAGLGIIFLPAIAIFFSIKPEYVGMIIQMLPFSCESTSFIYAFIFCVVSAMILISAPSVSLEAKKLWILKTIPIKSGTVLMAKANAQAVTAIPASVISSFILSIVLRLPIVDAIALIILPAVFNYYCAIIGVVINLRFPKLDWINETMAIKQGISTMIAMSVTFFTAVAVFGVYVAFLSGILKAWLYMLIASAVLAAFCVLMVKYLYGAGSRRFEALE